MTRQARGRTALDADDLSRVRAVVGAYRLARSSPDRAAGLSLIVLELEAALGDLRGADEPLGTALVEVILSDLRAEQREMARATADAEATERRRRERADILDAPRQVEHLDAEGGASDLSIGAYLRGLDESAAGGC